MLCGDITVQKQDCSVLDTEGKYMVQIHMIYIYIYILNILNILNLYI